MTSPTSVASAASSKLIAQRLYRNLLRASGAFTVPSPNATILCSLLQRTGMDDHLNWSSSNKTDESNNNFPDASTDNALQQNQARDLSLSYSDRFQQLRKGTKQHQLKESSAASHSTNDSRMHHRLFRRLLREVVTGSDGYAKLIFPSQSDPTRLRQVVQREFRNGHESVSQTFSDGVRRQVALTALRELNRKLAYFSKLQKMAPAPSRHQAALHVAPLPREPPSSYLRPGAFLVSHPYLNDSFFCKSVICILEHEPIIDSGSETPNHKESDNSSNQPIRGYKNPGQTYGLIINHISVRESTGRNRTLREAFQENMLPERMSSIFGNAIVRFGGPVHVTLQMIHSLSCSSDETNEMLSSLGGTRIPAVPNDNEHETSDILDSDKSVYFRGNLFNAMSAVEKGLLDRDDVSFYVGASTWGPGQLAAEVAQGYWIPCRGPPEMVLHGICEHEPLSDADSSTGSKRPLTDLWLSMMSACGEDEAKLAHLFYHEHLWDENGQACDAFDDDSYDDGF